MTLSRSALTRTPEAVRTQVISGLAESPPRTTPTPVFRLLAQSRLDWIVFNVGQRFAEMLFIADVAVIRFVLPKLAAASQQLVALVSREAFPGVADLAHGETGLWRK